MLTLGRKEGEVLSITHNGETLYVHVSMIKHNQVKLSFDGSESFKIWREEVNEPNTTTI